MFIGTGAASACTPHQCFINRVVSHLPYLHVDLTDGFRPQNFKLVFDYRALNAGTQPQYTCLRYGYFSGFADDHPCNSTWNGAGPAQLANVGPGSNVDHLDYPAPFTGNCGKLAASGTGNVCPEEALANKYWNNQPVIYFFGERDSLNQKEYQYWFFYSYNYFVLSQCTIPIICGPKIQGEYDLHEGDLEHIVVYTNAQDQPIAYRFYEHSGFTNYAASDGRLDTAGGHVRVYAGHGSHASEIGCNLYTNNVPLGQRDRTCVHDPYTDNVIGPSATFTYSPSITAISNLDVANWACFGYADKSGAQHRLGASHPDLGSGLSLNAPMPPLVQAPGECPNLYERQNPAASTAPIQPTPSVGASTADGTPVDIDGSADANTVEVPTADAYQGIDKCSDWETPDPQVGLKLLACNQASLTQSLDAAGQGIAPQAATEPSVQSTTSQPTELAAPSYATASTPQELQSDNVTTPSAGADVYVSQTEVASDGGAYELEGLFKGVTSPTVSLHADVTTMPWKLVDGSGNVIASATPDVRGCPLQGSALPPELASLPVLCSDVPAATNVRSAGRVLTWRIHGRLGSRTRLLVVAVDSHGARRMLALNRRTVSSRGERYRAQLRLPMGTRTVGVVVRRGGKTSISGLIRVR
jgi:hypothetical protein